jgi:hypothetical protein
MPRDRGEISWSAVHAAEKYRQLTRRLRDAGRGDLQRKLNKGIRREGAAMLRATQVAWLGVNVTEAPSAGGGESTQLRARTAAATRIQILQSGIRMSVSGNRVDPRYGKSITRGLDGLGRWRHPVHGNREVWVQQTGQEVFYATARRFEPRFRRGVEQVMEDVAREIAG